MKFIKKNWTRSLFFVFLIAFVFLSPVLSFAQSTIIDVDPTTPSNPNVGKLSNPIKADNINDFIKTLLEGVLKIGIPIVALAVIYSGFLFVSARGNAEKLGTAKDSLMYTLIGAAILLGSWAIATLISNTVLAL